MVRNDVERYHAVVEELWLRSKASRAANASDVSRRGELGNAAEAYLSSADIRRRDIDEYDRGAAPASGHRARLEILRP